LLYKDTDRIVRVARIIALAEQVFGDRDKALAWLRSADDRTSLSMLHTEPGGRLVESMLWQVDEGVYT